MVVLLDIWRIWHKAACYKIVGQTDFDLDMLDIFLRNSYKIIIL